MEVRVVLLKSRQKVEELSKSPKNLKSLKSLQKSLVQRNIYQSIDPLSEDPSFR